MMLLPIHCHACTRSALIDAERLATGQARCEACGARISAPLPGESYGLQDRALFKDIEAVLSEARLSPLNAMQLAVELESKSALPGEGLARLIQLLPSLAILELIVGSEPLMVRKAEGMLASLLEGIALGRSRSGIVRAVGAPMAPGTTKHGSR
jgi:hypothetical protein